VGGTGLQSPEDYEIYVQPELEYSLFDTGLTTGLAWEIPVLPDATIGSLESLTELEVVLSGLAVTAGNSTTVDLESSGVEGYAYASAAHALGDFSLELELDAGYLPAFEIRAIPGLAYEKEVGRCTVGLALEQTFTFYEQLEWGDTELTASLEAVAAGFRFRLEVEGVIEPGPAFGLSILTQVERPF